MLCLGWAARSLRKSNEIFRLTSLRRQSTVAPNNPFLKVSEEIREAINSKRPVVALETTIYTHGFPYPENVALASELETIVRINGAVPATIGILDGVARVGLSAEELIQLTSSVGKRDVLKISRRDLAFACGSRLAGKSFHGGTTIAGTMVLAHLAGINIFATGGLGGVHRGAESSMDISADLTELGRTPVTVISSGCKSFLDIPRTLEYLETEGVGVGTFADGRDGSVDYPAFWARNSGVSSPVTIKDEREAAAIVYAQMAFPLSSGLHFANPIPESAAIAKSYIDDIITASVKEAEEKGILGKDNTPYILSRIKDLTQGKSVAANRALVASNVVRGTKVAVELAKLETEGLRTSEQDRQEPAPLFRAAQVATSPPHGEAQSLESSSSVEISGSSEPPTVLVAGALAVDVSCDFSPSSSSSAALLPQQHTSNPAIISQSIGGVGHNVAKALHYLGAPVLFCSKIGDDVAGHAAIAALHEQSFPTAGVKISGKDTGQRTAQYVAVNDAKKDLVLAMADMSIFETPTAKEDFRRQWGHILDGVEPSTVVIDANWDHTTITRWLEYAEQLGGTTVLEPVSVAKCARLFSTRPGEESWFGTKEHAKRMALASPNALELASMHRAARDSGLMDEPRWWRYINELNIPSTGARDKFVQIMPRDFVDQGLPQMAIQMLPFISTIVTKLGANGVLLTQVLKRDDVRLREGDSAKYMLSRGEGEIGGVYMRYFPAVELVQDDEILSVNGVGDTFLGAIVAGMAKKGKQETRIEDLIDIGQKAAILTLKSTESASPELRALRGLIS